MPPAASRRRTARLAAGLAAVATIPAPVWCATSTSAHLELVAEDIESILKSAEEVAVENSRTYEAFVGAAADSCDGRLGNGACFDPANTFATLTQYIMYAQISLNPHFAFVNLNEPLGASAGDAAGAAAWGFSGWAQDLAGGQYYFTTDGTGHTNCFFPADPASPATLDLAVPPAFGFDYNPVNDSYIRAPLASATNESWTTVYPFNITAAGGSWSIDMFASYGVFNPVTSSITSVDIDLEAVDAFAKALPLNPAEKTIFVVEAATGTLVAVSDPAVDTHQHDDYVLSLAADCELEAVAQAVTEYGDLEGGAASRTLRFVLNNTNYVVNTKRLDGHTGAVWVVFEATNADVATDECECRAAATVGGVDSCTCFAEERDRVELVEVELDGILDAVEQVARVGGRTYQALLESPTLSNSSFDTLVRFVLFSQLKSPLDFAFVNLNLNPSHPSPAEWAINGWAVDSGSQYYFDTNDDVTHCWYGSPNTLNFSAAPDISFTYNSSGDAYIQRPLTSATAESWTGIYPWEVYFADGTTAVHLFASYGVYNSATASSSSADLDLSILDAFVKVIGADLAGKPGGRASVVFVVEASTGLLVAVSDPDTAPHDGWTVFSATNAAHNAVIAAATSAYGPSLDDSVGSKTYKLEVAGNPYDVRAQRMSGHTGLDWIVFQATQAAATVPHTTEVTSVGANVLAPGAASACIVATVFAALVGAGNR